jgi:hypothetical protein
MHRIGHRYAPLWDMIEQTITAHTIKPTNMNHLVIKIQEKKDLGTPLFPEIITNDTRVFHGVANAAGILEGGMSSGAASVSLLCSEPNSNEVIVLELSAAQLHALDAAVRGAESRWHN